MFWQKLLRVSLKKNVFHVQINLWTTDLVKIKQVLLQDFREILIYWCKSWGDGGKDYMMYWFFLWGSPMNNLQIFWHVVWKKWARGNWWKYSDERPVHLLLWWRACASVLGRFGYKSCLWHLTNAWLWKKFVQTHWDLVSLFLKWVALIKNVFGSKNRKIYQLLRGLFFWYNNESRVRPSRPNVVVCQCCLGPGSLCLSALTSLAWGPHVCKMAAAPSSSH